MSVRTKTLIVICLTFLALLGILYFTAQWFLLRDAVVTEEKSTTRDVTRLLAALDDRIAVMNATVSDWAPWDDTYEFISSGDTGYIDSNLSNKTFTDLGVELMLFINNSGQIVFGKMIDLDSGAEIPIPEGLYSELQVGGRLLSHKDPSDKMAGILSLPEGPMIIASQPIVTSQGEGPIRGTLIMGRRLDEVEIAKLSQITQLLISTFPYDDDVLPGDVALARNSLVGVTPIFVAPQSETVVSGYTLVNDVYGNPSLILRVDTPREAITQARMSMHYLGLALIVIGIVLGLVTMLLLERLVINRLTRLNSSVIKIGSQGTASSRLEANGNDEIFALSTSVNSMLDSLENSQAKEHESGERFRSLYENATIGIYRTTPDGHILMANPALVSLLGYESFEGLSKRNLAAEGFEPEYPRLEFQKRIEREGEIHGFESAWKRKDGSIRYVRESARLVRDEKDQPLYYEGTVEDVTEKKQAEYALQENEKKVRRLLEHQVAINQLALALGESLNLDQVYHTVCEHIRHLVDVWCFIISSYDEPAKLIRAEYAESDQVFDVSGFPPIPLGEAGQGTQSRVIRTGQPLYTPDHQEAVKDSQVRYTIEDDGSVHEELPSEKEKEDTTRSIVYLPMKIKGKTVGVMQVQSCKLDAYSEEDITLLAGMANVAAVATQNARLYQDVEYELGERKRAEQELKEYSEHLEEMVEARTRALQVTQEQLVRQEKLAVLGQLAGGVGHELRNPLGVILNAIYYLKLVQPDANEKIKQYHAMIEHETHTAEKIITDLLDFARIKSVDREPVSVPELIQRVLDRYPLPETVLAKVKFPASLPKVFADPRQMEQVLGNLVVNAYQAMTSNGMLTIQAVRRKKEIAISVKDTGVGIPPENMSKLFEPLFTTKLKGIGLGLAVSKKLAEANGGRIEVQSEPGKGSTFTLVLSVHEVER
jgi:PAS domain S-box-containing protein